MGTYLTENSIEARTNLVLGETSERDGVECIRAFRAQRHHLELNETELDKLA